MEQRAFQEDLAAIGFEHCWGCGVANEHGLRIKSYWSPDDEQEAICVWQPQPYHVAAPGIVNGGIGATLIDCHSAATAVAAAYRAEGRPISAEHPHVYVTAQLDVTYLKATPAERPLTLRAVSSRLASGGYVFPARSTVCRARSALAERSSSRARARAGPPPEGDALRWGAWYGPQNRVTR